MNCFLKWAISFEEREAPAYDEKAVKELCQPYLDWRKEALK